MTIQSGNYHFCSWCAKLINTENSHWVCDNKVCVSHNKRIDPNTGELKNV